MANNRQKKARVAQHPKTTTGNVMHITINAASNTSKYKFNKHQGGGSYTEECNFVPLLNQYFTLLLQSYAQSPASRPTRPVPVVWYPPKFTQTNTSVLALYYLQVSYEPDDDQRIYTPPVPARAYICGAPCQSFTWALLCPESSPKTTLYVDEAFTPPKDSVCDQTALRRVSTLQITATTSDLGRIHLETYLCLGRDGTKAPVTLPRQHHTLVFQTFGGSASHNRETIKDINRVSYGGANGL